MADSFERHRALPSDVLEAIRRAVLAEGLVRKPRLLDLGAGTGRIGRPFVAARDAYTGIDISLGMLRAFAARYDGAPDGAPRLVQADGRQLPFPNAVFDIVMLVQIFGGLHACPQLVAEAQRVLRQPGVLVLGRTIMPDDGVDVQMKQRLRAILAEMKVEPSHENAGRGIESLLASLASREGRRIAAQWQATRTARGFIERHTTGARFSAFPDHVKAEALCKLAAWAAQRFGSLDAALSERHHFELRIFKFESRAG